MTARPKRPVDNEAASSGAGEETLSPAEAAELLRCSRAHVRMLLNGGHLSATIDASAREPRITRVSVVAYANSLGLAGDADYKQAAESGGMYAIPDAAYLAVLAKRRATRKR